MADESYINDSRYLLFLIILKTSFQTKPFLPEQAIWERNRQRRGDWAGYPQEALLLRMKGCECNEFPRKLAVPPLDVTHRR